MTATITTCNQEQKAGPSSFHLKASREQDLIDSKEDLDTKSIHDLRLESSEKLKRAWQSIYDKFQDAHLQVQDEIYLGRRSVKGDRMRLIRDRGHLRGLPRTSLKFGCFYLDEAELIGCEIKYDKDAIEKDDRESKVIKSEDGVSCDADADTKSGVKDATVDRLVKFDPNLEDFLKAEAQSREILGDVNEESGEEGGSIRDEDYDVFASDSKSESSSSGERQRRKRSKWEAHSSDEGEDDDDEIRVYSLAQVTPEVELQHSIHRSSKKMKREHGSPLSPIDYSVEEKDTPPTSLPSSPPTDSILAFEVAATPNKLAASQKGAQSTRSTTKKQRLSAQVLLPRWEQQSPIVNRSAFTETQECTGLTRCTKSLCMLCGGFKRSSKAGE